MKTEKRFDELDHGTHFLSSAGKKFIKVKNMNSGWLGFTVWFQDDWGNRNRFNAVGYDGTPINFDWNEKVTVFDFDIIPNIRETVMQGYVEESTKDDLNREIKNLLDILNQSVKVVQSDSTTVVDDDIGNKNKQIESSKTVKTTFNTLTEAVVAAINELKAAGKLSAYQVTQLIRQKTNQDEWEVADCVARPNNANIKFWINHDDVRRIINEMYANNELDILGFTGRQYNGQFLEYSFDVNAPVAAVVSVSSTTPPAPTVPVPTTNATLSGQRVLNCIDALKNLGGTITLKRVQSALKVKGVTCKDLSQIVANLGYTVQSGSTSDFYSEYTVL